MRISAFLARFKADFGHIGRIGRRPLRPDMADTARFWPNQLGLVRIEADSARIEPRRCGLSLVGVNPRKKKKKLRRGTDVRATASNAMSRVKPRRTWVRHPPSHVCAF